jgi:O-antigen/teichoic acid export membrane protein
VNRVLLRNSVSNLLGAAWPAIVALVSVPFIVARLGAVDYGILSMVIAVVGYFALLDLNVTSGSVKYVAQYRASGSMSELSQVVTFGAITYLVIGLAGAMAIYLGAGWLSRQLFNVPAALLPLARRTLELAAAGFFFGQIQVYLVSLPQSLQRFDVSAVIEAAFGTLVPLSTVLVLALGYGLVEIVLTRVVLSALHVGVAFLASRRLMPGHRLTPPTRAVVRKLVSFSAFASLSRIASAVHTHADKLIIGAVVGMAGLTYYVIPSMLINRIFGLTYRLAGVVYPAASELESLRQFERLRSVYFTATRYVFYLNACFVVLACLFAREILRSWMGEEFALNGALVMVLTAVAMLVDSMTNLPSLLTDGMGHPRVTGTFSIFRAGFGLAVTFVCAKAYGIVGAAVGHLITSAVAATAFLIFVHRGTIPFRLGELVRECHLATCAVLGVSGAAFAVFKAHLALNLVATLAFAASILLAYAVFGFSFILTPAHRRSLRAAVTRVVWPTKSDTL